MNQRHEKMAKLRLGSLKKSFKWQYVVIGPSYRTTWTGRPTMTRPS